MANGNGSAVSSTGFWGGLLSGISGLFPAAGPALPTRPGPSQILIAQNAGRIWDAGTPVLADLYINPVAGQKIIGYEPFQVRDPRTGAVLYTENRPVYGPTAYFVKSTSPEAVAEAGPSPTASLFQSPDAAALISRCAGDTADKAAGDVRERINRLSNNSFLSAFRARRSGSSSYQAVSEEEDDLFDRQTGKPGVFGRPPYIAIQSPRGGHPALRRA